MIERRYFIAALVAAWLGWTLACGLICEGWTP